MDPGAGGNRRRGAGGAGVRACGLHLRGNRARRLLAGTDVRRIAGELRRIAILPSGHDGSAGDERSVAVGAGGSLWVSSDDTALMRVDPGSGRITSRIATGGGVPFVENDGLLWGAKTDELWAVDARTGRIVRRIPLEDSEEVLAMALEGRSIWLGMRHFGRVGAVERLALGSGEVLADVPVDIPARIVAAFGSIWVTDSGSGDLYRIDPDVTGSG